MSALDYAATLTVYGTTLSERAMLLRREAVYGDATTSSSESALPLQLTPDARATIQDPFNSPAFALFLRQNLSDAKNSWIGRFQTALGRFTKLVSDWDTHGADVPRTKAVKAASALLECLWDRQLRPQRIAPTVEGGVIVFFFGSGAHASIEATAEGTLVVAQRLHAAADTDVQEIDLGDDESLSASLAQIDALLSNGSAASDVQMAAQVSA